MKKKIAFIFFTCIMIVSQNIYALAAGIDPVYSAIIGNVAASLVVRQFGCATTTVDELLTAVEKL